MGCFSRRLTALAWVVAGFGAAGLSQTATGLRAREPLDLIPADSLLCWSSRPTQPEAHPDAGPGLAAWLDMGSRLVGKPLEGQLLLNLRILESLGKLTRHRHAIAVIDTGAKPTDTGGRKIDKLELALVVEVSADADWLRRTIQRVLNEQADSSNATLKELKVGGWNYQELRHTKLQPWAAVAWGEVGPFFVITVGEGVWPRLAALAAGDGRSMAADPWFVEGRSRRARVSMIEVVAAMQGIRERLDPLVDGRATDFFDAWEAADTERAYWAIDLEGRAVYCAARFARNAANIGASGGGHAAANVERIYADPSAPMPSLLQTIPEEAQYAIVKLPMRRFVPRLVSSLLATRSELLRDNVRRHWERIQKEMGFDAQRDVLDHLGDYVILHNSPRHPLRIPIAMTILVEIRDNPEQVRKTIDKMCHGWQTALDRANAESATPSPLAVRRDDDGIWYLQLGLAGPAWTVTDRFIITCWSPAALRSYLEQMRDRVGRPMK